MIGRKDEIRRLNLAFESKESEFVAIYGRRRIGKTYLVNETFGSRISFRHAGVKNGTRTEQLEQFRFSLRRQGHWDCPKLRNWMEAFFELECLLERMPEGRKIVFLDEMPWMDTVRSGFLIALEGFWNGWASARKDILLIACGSATSWIVKNILRNKDGLYNRVRTRIKMFPFTLGECEEYADERGLAYDRLSIAECYMAFGGVAYYWSLLEKGLSPEQNFNQLFFGPQDGLRLEFDELYSSLFANPEPYRTIVGVLGDHRSGLTRDEIAAETGIASGGDLTRYIENLEECGFIRKYLPVDGGLNGGTYQLIDNFTLFYLQFMRDEPSRSGDFWTARVPEGRKNDWRGHAFERLCLEHVAQIKTRLGISGVSTEVYSWYRAASKDMRGAQVDLLIDRKDGIVNLCEMKYASGGPYALEKEEFEKLRSRMQVYREVIGVKRSIHLTLVTTFGLAPSAYRNHVQSEVTLDDLFKM
ncbi:MAG: AAA family ATPase [Kiritimatiellae bacterium]|nr:AAA family ATPase [Kiritimatiellia bacterium]